MSPFATASSPSARPRTSSSRRCWRRTSTRRTRIRSASVIQIATPIASSAPAIVATTISSRVELTVAWKLSFAAAIRASRSSSSGGKLVHRAVVVCGERPDRVQRDDRDAEQEADDPAEGEAELAADTPPDSQETSHALVSRQRRADLEPADDLGARLRRHLAGSGTPQAARRLRRPATPRCASWRAMFSSSSAKPIRRTRSGSAFASATPAITPSDRQRSHHRGVLHPQVAVGALAPAADERDRHDREQRRRLRLDLPVPEQDRQRRHEQDPAADPEQAGRDAGCHADQRREDHDVSTSWIAAATSRTEKANAIASAGTRCCSHVPASTPPTAGMPTSSASPTSTLP